jgi:glycosyltransferase involved in cell wall biosynthesis
MKILWFTNTPSLYDQGKHSYHGGGWIESLEELVSKQNDVELAVSFFHTEGFQKEQRGNTTYYPILKKSGKKTPLKAIFYGLIGEIESENKIIPNLLKVIEDFEPDVIQVFGTEGVFASIQKYTNIPVVIHLQGLITPYLNTYFPPNQSHWSFIFSKNFIFKNLTGRGIFASFIRFQKQSEREKQHFFNTKNIMGRTHWDYLVSKIYSPDSQYFHVEEVLRSVFYNTIEKEYKLNDTITIVSTLSDTIYKGIDVVLKSAKLLKEQTNINFKWQIIGLDGESDLLNHFICTFKINPKEFNIEFIGKKNANELISVLLEADLFIHPSYIDNSPNSVCEAQIIGLPVIACDVGGLSTLIENNKTGILVPSNGLFEIVSTLTDYIKQPEKYFLIGKNAREFALKRHDKKNIIDDLIKSYLKIIHDNK